VNRGAIQNHDFSPNLPSNPAKPGEAVIVYMTGLGDTDIPVASGQPSPNPAAHALAKVTAHHRRVAGRKFSSLA